MDTVEQCVVLWLCTAKVMNLRLHGAADVYTYISFMQ